MYLKSTDFSKICIGKVSCFSNRNSSWRIPGDFFSHLLFPTGKVYVCHQSRCHNIFKNLKKKKSIFFVIVQEFKDISVNECSKSDLAQLKPTFLQSFNPLTSSSEQFLPTVWVRPSKMRSSLCWLDQKHVLQKKKVEIKSWLSRQENDFERAVLHFLLTLSKPGTF